jgi:hypothetical protein
MPDEAGGAKPASRLATVAGMVQVLSVVTGVAISVATFFTAQAKEADARRAEAETRRLELQKLEHDQREKSEQAAREAVRPFLQLRQDRYLEVVRAAAVLIASAAHRQDEVDAAHKRFFELYWAELSMVEDKQVEAAMVKLGNEIDPRAVKGTEAQKASYDLAHALRDSLVRSWRIGEDPTLVLNPSTSQP